MKSVKITAKIPKDNKECSINVNLPENFAEAAKMYGGEEKVFDIFIQELTVKVQAGMRSRMAKGHLAPAIEAELKDYKPGQRTTSAPVDPIVTLRAELAAATPEEKAKKIKELQELLKS